MAPPRTCLFTAVFCLIVFMVQAGTWLPFNQRVYHYNNLAPYATSTMDLARILRMCKEEYNKRDMISGEQRNSDKICAALFDLVSKEKINPFVWNLIDSMK